ncbi:EboA domain-containing protein [Georgenia sunbinii]|uniref:EboA domain-containing protein n=1 Tax=Georgenia sunbinii TaxID=3117728 RepID=UPI002F26AAD0
MTGPSPDVLAGRLSPEAQQRLAEIIAAVTADPAAVQRLFPAAAREVARGPLDDNDPSGIGGPTLDDAVRGAILAALVSAEPDAAALRREVDDLYRFGDGDEKRAILRSLADLGLGADAAHLVEDALRTNDVRLVGAAMGAWAGEHLDDATWRQGVLKCMFVGVPLSAVHRLTERADAELARMVAAFGHERLAAGRDIAPDAHRVLDLFPHVLEQFPDVAAAMRTVPEP